MQRFKIIHIAAEAFPWIKVGGLGDVVGALTRYLNHAGHTVTLFIPYLGGDKSDSPTLTFRIPDTTTEHTSRECQVYGLENRTNHQVLGIKIPGVLDAPPLYAGQNPEKDLQKFVLFSIAVITLAHELNIKCDLIHIHDWHACPVLIFLNHPRFQSHPWATKPSVLTIHNLSYQGDFPIEPYRQWVFPDLRPPEWLIHRQRLNILKAGLVTASRVTTVSPTYAKEILTPAYGEGLEDVLNTLDHPPMGILNGIDISVWNPSTDALIPFRYTAHRLEKKWQCKLALGEKYGLSDVESYPLVGLISRLVYQKGIDILLDTIPAFLEQNRIRMIVLGSGDPDLEAGLVRLQNAYSGRFAFIQGYHEPLAHWIEAGSDIYLMPSRFEPCGLNQMYSQRYGTIPLVADTGGLVDSVPDFRQEPDRGTGLRFHPGSKEDLKRNLELMLTFYRNRDLWHTFIYRAMGQDFSWETTIKKYLELYECILAEAKNGKH